MLDLLTTTTAGRDALDLATPGDIVAFAYPHGKVPEGETPELRPCLVIEAQRRGGQLWLTLAPASFRDSRSRLYAVRVVDPQDVANAGLARPLRFVIERAVTVRLDAGFPSHPFVGRLSGKPLAQMHAVRAKIHALRDIAAHRYAEALRERSEAIQPTLPGFASGEAL